MSDFAQTGAITTFQLLREPDAAAIEAEVTRLADATPIALILPCHAAELGTRALAHLVAELRPACFLREIVVSMNGLPAGDLPRAAHAFASLPQPVRILATDHPSLRAVAAAVGFSGPVGKGFNVWAATGLLLAEGAARIIATQDCDVASFRRATLARLCLPCADPRLGYGFAKGYYSRVRERLYGRVTRLFVGPLLRAFVRVAGDAPLLHYLHSFRYPLAGETALSNTLAARLPACAGWGLEIGQLCETFRYSDPRQVCQVDGGGDYDHRHQPLGDGATGLTAMCRDIAQTLLAELAADGLEPSATFLRTLTAAYRDEARENVRRYAHLARMNALPFDEPAEHALTEAFAPQLAAADAPTPAALPPWETVLRKTPELAQTLRTAAHEAKRPSSTLSS